MLCIAMGPSNSHSIGVGCSTVYAPALASEWFLSTGRRFCITITRPAGTRLSELVSSSVCMICCKFFHCRSNGYFLLRECFCLSSSCSIGCVNLVTLVLFERTDLWLKT